MEAEQQKLSPEKVLVDLIRNNLDELCLGWMRIVRNSQITRSYGVFDQDVVLQRIKTCYTHLAQWMAGEFSKADIASFYTSEGAARRREGFKLAEVVRAFIVARRVLWYKVRDEGFVDPSMSADMALLINNRVMLFFDRAVYYTTIGYERT